MAENVIPGLANNCAIKEAVSIHTRKIYDACRDKDCVEDLRLYLTPASQCAIENATSIRAKTANLICANISVEEVTFNRGYYTIDVRYFYKIQGEACTLMNTPVDICGLAIFDKRVILFGSEGSSKIFTSDTYACGCPCTSQSGGLPTAVVEAVDPIVLSMKLVDSCNDGCDCNIFELPQCIYEEFGSDISFENTGRRVYVTLGQFTIVRLERDTQIIVPTYDYYMPDKECLGSGEDDACTLFSRIHFPVDEFFPPDTLEMPEGYKEARSTFGG